MKDYKDMDHNEKISYSVGMLLIAIGEGTFREAVASLIGAVSADAYNKGKQWAYKHPEPALGDIPPEWYTKNTVAEENTNG